MNEEIQPYRNMGSTCCTRKIEKVRLKWASLPQLVEEPQNIKWDFVSEDEVPLVADVWKKSYPELRHSSLDFIFHPQMYKGKVMLRENYQRECRERDRCMLRWERDGEIVAAMMLTKWDENRQVELTIGAILPHHRKVENIFVQGFPAVMDWLRRTGAEYLTAFCETWHDLSQRLLETNGFKLCGIFPGQCVRWTSGDLQYRGCLVHYYRFIRDGAEFATRPEEWRLSERAAGLWEALTELNGGKMFDNS